MDEHSEQSERLELLTELLNSGRLSETDYLRARVAILKGETVPSDIIVRPERASDSADLNLFTTVDPKSRKRRIQQISRATNEVDAAGPNSELLNALDSGTWRNASSSENDRPPTSHVSVIEEARKRRESQLTIDLPQERGPSISAIFVPLLAIVGIALVSTAVMSSSSPNAAGRQIQSEVPPPFLDKATIPPPLPVKTATASAPVQKTTGFVPLFGPEAQTECLQTCELKQSSLQTACQRACLRLSPENYARRITLKELSPSHDAQKISSRCLIAAEKAVEGPAPADWAAEVRDALALLDSAPSGSSARSYTQLRSLYSSAKSIFEKVTPPANPNDPQLALTTDTRNAVCLRANLTLVEIALLLTQQRQDSYSQRYYANLGRALKPRVLDAEGNVLISARKMEIVR